MAILPTTNLKINYQLMADAILNEVNPGYIVLIYENGLTAANPSGENYTYNLPTLADRHGFENPINETDGRIEESNSSNLQVQTTSESIKARIYWQNKNYDEAAKRLNLNLIKNVCKVIIPIGYTQNLKNAKEASIDDRRVKMIRPPVPYGLFEDRYCISYWEEIGV